MISLYMVKKFLLLFWTDLVYLSLVPAIRFQSRSNYLNAEVTHKKGEDCFVFTIFLLKFSNLICNLSLLVASSKIHSWSDKRLVQNYCYYYKSKQ